MSAVNSSAYLSASKLFCEYDQEHKDYRYKQNELFHEEVMLPVNAPPEYADREKLWNSAEAVETQWNSQLARKMRFALPREVPPEQWTEMVRQYYQEHFVSRGMCVDFAIHDPAPPGHNPHVHLLLTMRSLDEEGRYHSLNREIRSSQKRMNDIVSMKRSEMMSRSHRKNGSSR